MAGRSLVLVSILSLLGVTAQAQTNSVIIDTDAGSDDLMAIAFLVAHPSVSIEAVTVNGSPGFWVTGQPHEILYLDPNGTPIPNSVRLSGNVLLWQQGDVTLRIESALTKAEALRIADSVR